MKIRYSAEAVEDLKRLREFIEIKNPAAAADAAQSIVKGVSRLKAHPLLGKVVSKAPDPESFRDLIVNKYTVRYMLVSDYIYILRIWHHREDKP